MPKFCVAHGCYNRSNKVESRQKDISFHRFPLKDPVRLKEWLIEIQRENFQPNKHSVLCSEHFNDDDFNITSKRRRSLKVDAVPSKFSFSKPFGKRKRLYVNFIKRLPETIVVHHAAEENQSGAIFVPHVSEENQSEAIVVHHASEENQSGAIVINHVPQESQSKVIVINHASLESQSKTVVNHASQESQEEATIGCVPPESKSKAIIGHNVLQENLVASGSERNIHLEGLSRDLSKLLNDNSSCDVLLLCEGKMFRAHTIILKMRSAIFSSVFKTEMVGGARLLIKIEGFSASVFQGLLQYLYTGRVPELNQETAKQFYEIADRYGVIELKKASSDFLAKNVSQASACDTLLFAVKHTDNDFRNNVISSIVDKKIPEFDSGWPDFCKNHPILANEVMLLYIQRNRSNSVA